MCVCARARVIEESCKPRMESPARLGADCQALRKRNSLKCNEGAGLISRNRIVRKGQFALPNACEPRSFCHRHTRFPPSERRLPRDALSANPRRFARKSRGAPATHPASTWPRRGPACPEPPAPPARRRRKTGDEKWLHRSLT